MRGFLISLLGFLLVVEVAFAIQQEFRFTKIDFKVRTISAQETTIVGFDRTKLTHLGKVQGWGVIEVYYDSIPEWADDVEVKYYVLMKGRTPNRPVMLVGSIVYIHVQKGEGHISTIYIPPQAIARYGDAERIRAELWYNGILQDSIQWPKIASKMPWWTKVKPIYGSLFNRFYTPFEHEAQAVEDVIKTQ